MPLRSPFSAYPGQFFILDIPSSAPSLALLHQLLGVILVDHRNCGVRIGPNLQIALKRGLPPGLPFSRKLLVPDFGFHQYSEVEYLRGSLQINLGAAIVCRKRHASNHNVLHSDRALQHSRQLPEALFPSF